MLIKKISIILCATAGMLVSSFGSAQTYLGGSVGQNDTNYNCNYSTTCDSKATSFKVFGGYDINKNFAVESSYFSSGKTSVNAGLLGGVEIKKTGLSLAGLYKYEFNEALAGFARLLPPFFPSLLMTNPLFLRLIISFRTRTGLILMLEAIKSEVRNSS